MINAGQLMPFKYKDYYATVYHYIEATKHWLRTMREDARNEDAEWWMNGALFTST